MQVLWLLIGLVIGLVIGWYVSGRRSSAEVARFEGRLEELQGQLVRERRAHAALKAEHARGCAPCEPDDEPPVVATPTGAAVGSAVERADDLTRIKGIGPVLQRKLNGLGITTFKQIANFAPADIERVNEVLDFRGRIEREDWIGQAKKIVEGRG